MFRAVRHFVCRRGATAEREVPGSDRARPDASVSKWPCPPQVHRASPKPGRWPISPAAPWGPSYRSPAIHRAPPTPVPSVIASASRAPAIEPVLTSPRRDAFTSLSSKAGASRASLSTAATASHLSGAPAASWLTGQSEPYINRSAPKAASTWSRSRCQSRHRLARAESSSRGSRSLVEKWAEALAKRDVLVTQMTNEEQAARESQATYLAHRREAVTSIVAQRECHASFLEQDAICGFEQKDRSGGPAVPGGEHCAGVSPGVVREPYGVWGGMTEHEREMLHIASTDLATAS